jgi:putative tryptophan/tyrosine transport system substrate-binding protein
MAMRRREFIAVLGGAAAWPLVALGQQPPVPVIAWLEIGGEYRDPDLRASRYGAFTRGLSEVGVLEGRDVAIDHVPVSNLRDLPGAVKRQVQRKVAIIYGILLIAVAAKEATHDIPIVFATTDDPLPAGVIDSYARPGGNVTGIRMRAGDETSKLFELLHELIPGMITVGVLVYQPSTGADVDIASVTAAARSLSVNIIVTHVSSENEFEAAFAGFERARVHAVFLVSSRYFDARRTQLVALANHGRLPLFSLSRDVVVSGGLASYGADIADGSRQAGTYVGRVLKGEKPADMPILQPTKFTFAINLKTARKLGITVSESLLVRADEVIE